MKKIKQFFIGIVIVNGFKNYRANTKGMSFLKKLEYIKDYYLKDVLLFGGIAAIIISVLVSSYLVRHTDYILYGVAVNIDLTTAGTEYLNDDFFELHKTGGRQKIDFSCVVIDDFSTTDDAEASYYSSQSVIAQVSAKRLDYLLLDEVAFQHFASQEIYMDLNNFLTAEELEQFGNQIVYVQEEGKEEMMPAGIKITDSEFIKNNYIKHEEVFIAFAGNAPHKELAHEFLSYLLAYKK